MKDNKILIVTALALLLLLTTGLSYVYFSTAVKGNDNAKDVIVEAGTLKLTYTDGPAINAQYIKPGWSTTKEVSIKNNGTLDANYNIIWQSLTNTIINDELVISATCQRLNASGTVEGTCESISRVPISDMTIAKKISIESGIIHKYTFTILFKETNEDQNYNQGKKFSGVLGIEEYKANFTNEPWNEIIANVKVGRGSVYKVGDTKEVDLGTVYGTHTLRVANTSTPNECKTEGFSQSACGFVLEFADIITVHAMNDTNTNVGGWPASSMRTFVNNDIYNTLPDEIKSAIIDTIVVSSHGSTSGEENFTSIDKLYLLALSEPNVSGPPITDYGITRTLDYYIGTKSLGIINKKVKKKYKTSSASEWWLRSTSSANDSGFLRLGIEVSSEYASDSAGVSPAFRIG